MKILIKNFEELVRAKILLEKNKLSCEIFTTKKRIN